ncbi:MAG: hypothetical protein JOZ10_07920 [Acidobacteria bacterium]|nr:hypothetical protein [Acidobacteriota bacterium]MBV9144464.1 hypothetical protein [Acidobacteriota bacterium]MBV9436894.1 hypothetical protein [Acidobacteriota bacterium]
MSTGPVVEPRQETVYDGPEVDLFKPRHLKDDQPLPESGKETIHDGEVPEFITRRFNASQVAQLQKPQTETVHQGQIPEMFAKLGRIAHDLVMPDRETIYSGPDVHVKKVVDVSYLEKSEAASDKDQPQKETVFDETTFIAKKLDTTASRSLVTRLVQRASVRFFAVAAQSLIELYICRENLPVAISAGIMFVTFSIVGFYTFKMNLKALLAAIGIYACTTLFMAGNAIMTDNIFMMMVPLLSRGFMIYNLLRTYGLLVDLHLLEAEAY